MGGAADIRHCNRALIGRGVLLTVPVEGGSRSLKRLEHACVGRAEARAALRSPRISLHGDWPRVHLGALEAVYGRGEKAPGAVRPRALDARRAIPLGPRSNIPPCGSVLRVWLEFHSEFTGLSEPWNEARIRPEILHKQP